MNSIRPRSSSHIERQTQALNRHIQDIRQQKQLLEDEMKKAVNDEAIQELKSSIFLLDKDLHSMTSILSKKEQTSTSTTTTTTTTSTQPIGIVNSLFGVFSSVSNYWNWPSSTSSSSTTSTGISPPKEYKDAKGSSYSEFEVMQINWYWRQQKRILRISKDRILRINPYTKELRAMHYFRNIKEIVVSGNTFMTIYFNDSSHPEYYQSVDLDLILSKLTEKASPTVIPVSYVKE